jgi:mRNA interferase RelE/StbE
MRIVTALEVLQAEPRPPAMKALVGHPGYLRVITGNHRIVYTIVDDRLLILVLALGNRKDVYRSFERRA